MKTKIFFRKTRMWTWVLLAGGLLFFAACKKEEDFIIPSWYPKAAAYYYDLDSAGRSIQNFSVIEVRQINPGILEFVERIQHSTRFHYSSLTDLSDMDICTQREGLFKEYSNGCGFITLGGSTRYLAVPANPKTGQQIPLYVCAKTLYGTDTIATVGEMITVAAGEFISFSIAHHNGDRSWWNQDIGLVQYETSMKVDTGNVFLRVRLKLRKVESY